MTRTIAIGDIHGCSRALAAIVELIQPSASDTLITLGDYVDKGIDSAGTLELLLEIEQQCELVPLLGNHDLLMLRALEGDISTRGWKKFGGLTTLQSYGDTHKTDDIPDDHIDFLRRCRLFHETSSHFFVHGAYEPGLPLRQQDDATLLWQSIRHEIPGPHVSGKTAIVGHTSQKDGEILDVGHLICIDTWCWGGGWLTALDIEDGTVWQVDEDGKARD